MAARARRTWARRILAGLMACGAAAIAPPDARAATDLTLTAEDGVTLTASLWEPAGRPLAGVVLVHGPARTRHDWDRLGDQLARRGFLAVAVDLRGHGESLAVEAGGDLAAMGRDVVAAARYLLSHAGGPVELGVIGVSMGGTLGVLAAQAVPAIRSFAWVSTPLDFRGLRIEEPLRKLGERPALVIASNEDTYAARSARTLAETGPGLREIILVEGAGHGARILTSRPDLLPVVVDWFVRTLL